MAIVDVITGKALLRLEVRGALPATNANSAFPIV